MERIERTMMLIKADKESIGKFRSTEDKSESQKQTQQSTHQHVRVNGPEMQATQAIENNNK